VVSTSSFKSLAQKPGVDKGRDADEVAPYFFSPFSLDSKPAVTDAAWCFLCAFFPGVAHMLVALRIPMQSAARDGSVHKVTPSKCVYSSIIAHQAQK
jgi:hypothetical protein